MRQGAKGVGEEGALKTLQSCWWKVVCLRWHLTGVQHHGPALDVHGGSGLFGPQQLHYCLSGQDAHRLADLRSRDNKESIKKTLNTRAAVMKTLNP